MVLSRLFSRRLTAFLTIVLCLILTLGTTAASLPQVKVKTLSVQLVFDGKTLAIPKGQYVFSFKNRIYVPLRFISYALQKSVAWDSKKQTVTVKDPTANEKAAIQTLLKSAVVPEGQVPNKVEKQIKVTPVQAKFVFDGKTKLLPKGQGTYSLSGSIYVPISFVAESTGAKITWDGKLQKVLAESLAYQKLHEDSTVTGTYGAGGNEGIGNEAGGAPSDGGNSAPQAYDTITAGAEQRLHTLETSCQNSLIEIALSASDASSTDQFTQLKGKGESTFTQCTVQFNQIVDETQRLLTQYGYSTVVIQQYKDYFNEQVAKGRELLETLMD